ncbi:hypothetical protein O9G_004434 [Rozella allomycis CSF55]|uniref:Uncharacterized protein n=1 Tax=Rozella allomycis (strain CSF55) TaxID=988480 RepID=A0A075AU08_ROZAC|nr:hypothetical protein O9G_004434 [Rozella allomycis CSF55]|eukprot:EPZ33786.1 hypothetical protein O9G_004434 [Rozella allomycis CSF55]
MEIQVHCDDLNRAMLSLEMHDALKHLIELLKENERDLVLVDDAISQLTVTTMQYIKLSGNCPPNSPASPSPTLKAPVNDWSDEDKCCLLILESIYDDATSNARELCQDLHSKVSFLALKKNLKMAIDLSSALAMKRGSKNVAKLVQKLRNQLFDIDLSYRSVDLDDCASVRYNVIQCVSDALDTFGELYAMFQ